MLDPTTVCPRTPAAAPRQPRRMPPVQRAGMRRRQLLSRAEKDPELALERGWFRDPEFCRCFFDRCEQQALTLSPANFELAQKAVGLAARNGDAHLHNHGVGVLSHALIVRGELFLAGQMLHLNRDRAIGCCPLCRSDHLRREGDLLGEEGRAAESLEALNLALDEGGRHLDGDATARTLYLRGIAHHFRGHRRRAIADAGHTLMQLDMGSPRGFFHDALAFLAIFVAGGGPDDDAAALEVLDRFRRRLRGRERWKDAWTRLFWVEGHLHARLGDARAAREDLDRAEARLLADGLAREAVAVTLDGGLLRSRHPEPRDDNLRQVRHALERCCARRGDLTDEHRGGLVEMQKVVEVAPEAAFRELLALRRSFIAPVPGCLAERVGER